MPDIDLSRTREWLTLSERRLVAASRGPALANARAGEVKKKIALARSLRDKWRDVYVRQRREDQQGRKARASTANQRSRQKSELFGKVLARFEAQLEKVTAAPAARSAARKTAVPSKSRRTRQHRQVRSRVKRSLADHVAERESAEVRSARAALPPMQTRTPPKAGAPRRKTSARVTSSSAPRTGKARSQSGSAATRHRTRMSGLTTRIRGHVSARGTRAQARRDRRG